MYILFRLVLANMRNYIITKVAPNICPKRLFERASRAPNDPLLDRIWSHHNSATSTLHQNRLKDVYKNVHLLC